ncbi:hypothetical protein [Protofrankia symbiont of Coriaria myrtifolia]|uniref:hypothetical protein n=1 Tax=Protofrankia symbiont of Coriaria myrtifolia TaxID=1306540 RepID=UPI0001C53CCF|nr:hypothetical protein [Protofrankia symbiont of Coriaria myrtifolia]
MASAVLPIPPIPATAVIADRPLPAVSSWCRRSSSVSLPTNRASRPGISHRFGSSGRSGGNGTAAGSPGPGLAVAGREPGKPGFTTGLARAEWAAASTRSAAVASSAPNRSTVTR